MDLASPAALQVAVYANGLTNSPDTYATLEDNLQSDHHMNLNSCVANYLMLCAEDNTCIALNIRQCVLDFILSRDILPCCQKNSFVHLSIFSKENIHWDLASKVEYINVVFNGNLHKKKLSANTGRSKNLCAPDDVL